VEALLIYELLDQPVSQETADAEVAHVLASDDCDKMRQEAYGLVSRIFEDVFQGVYYHAIENLNPSDRARLLSMSALGAPDYSSTPDWALGELRKYDDPIVLPAFQHFASAINTKAFSTQEAIANFCRAVAGCARFLEEPTPLRSPATDEGKAWEAYGAILFWLAKPGLTDDDRRMACAPHWQRLETDFAFEAVDPLFEMERAGWMSPGGMDCPLEILCRAFPIEVRRILEFGIQHHARLTGIFPGTWRVVDRRKFLVNRLGDLGNEQSARLLEPWADDALLGRHVVEALRKIRENGSRP
jgi:hypothetical protein